MATIRLDGLRKEFDGGVVAVHDLTVSFEQGSVTCLLGPSGCGKTTLMRMIAGLETPTSGSIFFDDVEVTNTKTRERDLGMVFQYPVVYRGTTVRENIALPLRREPLTRPEKANRVDEVLSLLGLEDVADSDVSLLDNATRQKVAVARSISRRPPIILFDEPITNVDIHAKLRLKQALKELFSQLKQTVVYVTHDQTEAMTLADNIALMKDGAIKQLASPRSLYRESASVFAGWFLGNPGMNFVDCRDASTIVSALLGGRSRKAHQIGFRPEDVHVATEPAGLNDATFPATVRHVALVTGGQLLVSLSHGEHSFKAKLAYDSDLSIGKGSEVHCSVPAARILTFDAQGNSIAKRDLLITH